MPSIANLDWLNLNSLRNYPIQDDLSRMSIDGVYTIPNTFIVDAQIAASYDPTRLFYISQLSNLGSDVVLTITDNLYAVVGSFTIALGGFSEYSEYYLTPSAGYVGATGVVTIGSVADINNLPTGTYSFAIGTTQFVSRAIIPALQGINRLIFQNADNTSFALTGDVNILARTNLCFTLISDTNTVVMDAGDGLGLNQNCTSELPCINTINGIPPDTNGNFTLDFSDCATLTPIPAGTGLVLDDVCCKPCMGCSDITVLTDRLIQVESGLAALREYFNSLNTLFDNYKTTISYTCSC